MNGAIHARDLADDVQLQTVNGSIEASFRRLASDQNVEIESVNGRVEISVPGNSDASVRADTVHGSLRNDFDLRSNKSFGGTRLNGQLGSGTAELRLNTVNGSISIRRNSE